MFPYTTHWEASHYGSVTIHVEYVHFEPVKYGLVSSAIRCQYSSFRRYVEARLYPADWRQGTMDFERVGQE